MASQQELRVGGQAFQPEEIPEQLRAIPELDLSYDVLQEPLAEGWFRLGVWSAPGRSLKTGVEDAMQRSTILAPPGLFSAQFDRLSSVGNVLANIGNAGGSLHYDRGEPQYRYTPFHQFSFMGSTALAEPLVFIREVSAGRVLFINPDLWLALELEERVHGEEWWDPKRAVEALRHRTIENGALEIVEIQTRHLKRYLQIRQWSLIVAHYRSLISTNTSKFSQKSFVGEDAIRLGSKERGVRAEFEGWGPQGDWRGVSYVIRRLHHWFEIKPDPLDTANPWIEMPDFDPYSFTLPGRTGLVYPGRWRDFPGKDVAKFGNLNFEAMDPIYFRQEVLKRYEQSADFEVGDDGSVRRGFEWGVRPGMNRIGNELLGTSVVEFAEGLPFDEWQHWKLHAVDTPTEQALKILCEEKPIPELVKGLFIAFEQLNDSGATLMQALGVSPRQLWSGSADTSAGRAIRAVYSAGTHDDQFIERATYLSTLVIDELEPEALRLILERLAEGLSKDEKGKVLRSRRLLRRLAFACAIGKAMSPNQAELLEFIAVVDGDTKCSDSELKLELDRISDQVRSELRAFECLYEIRSFGGVAHPKSTSKIAKSMREFGFREGGWRRKDYLVMLERVTASILAASDRIEDQLDVLK